MDRLIVGFGKGHIPDDRMRARMGALTDERDQCADKERDVGQKLLRLQAVEGMEEQGRRRLLEIILEDVTCHGDHAIVRTVIPLLDTELSGQPCVLPQGDQGGEACVSALHELPSVGYTA